MKSSGQYPLTFSRIVIFRCGCVSVWIQMSCCSSAEGRAGLIEQQYYLFVVHQTLFLFFPLPAVSGIGLDVGFFFFFFSLLFSNEERVAGCFLVCYWHPLSPRRSIPSPAPCLLLSLQVLSAKAMLWDAAWSTCLRGDPVCVHCLPCTINSVRSSHQCVGVLFLTSS